MNETILPFRQRLVGKMVLFGIVPTIALIGLIIGGNVVRAYGLFEEHVERELADATRIAAAELDLQNQRAAVTAELIGRAQVDGGMFGNRTATIDLLHGVFDSHPELQALSVTREPETPAGQRDVVHLERDRSAPKGVRVESGVDALHMQAYEDAQRRAERDGRVDVAFSRPVVHDEATLIQQSFPLVRDGRFIGVAAVERSLLSVEGTIASVGQRVGGDLFVATQGQYLAATTDRDTPADRRLQMAPVAGSPLERMMTTYIDSPGVVRVLRAVDPILGTECYYGVTRLREGD